MSAGTASRSVELNRLSMCPARQMVEVSQYLGDTVETVELRKMFFER